MTGGGNGRKPEIIREARRQMYSPSLMFSGLGQQNGSQANKEVPGITAVVL